MHPTYTLELKYTIFKDIINPYKCLLKKVNFSIKKAMNK